MIVILVTLLLAEERPTVQVTGFEWTATPISSLSIDTYFYQIHLGLSDYTKLIYIPVLAIDQSIFVYGVLLKRLSSTEYSTHKSR